MSDWNKVSKAMMRHPAVQKAWKDMAEAGIGSTVAAKKAAGMIRSSRWHILNLMTTGRDVVGMTEEDMPRINGKLLTLASVYLLLGISVGMGAAGEIGEEKRHDADGSVG